MLFKYLDFDQIEKGVEKYVIIYGHSETYKKMHPWVKDPLRTNEACVRSVEDRFCRVCIHGGGYDIKFMTNEYGKTWWMRYVV